MATPAHVALAACSQAWPVRRMHVSGLRGATTTTTTTYYTRQVLLLHTYRILRAARSPATPAAMARDGCAIDFCTLGMFIIGMLLLCCEALQVH